MVRKAVLVIAYDAAKNAMEEAIRFIKERKSRLKR